MKNTRSIYFMLYPRHATFFDSFWSYIAQSRIFLWLHMWFRFAFFYIINRGKIKTITHKDGNHISKVIHHNFIENFNLMIFSRGRIESLLFPLKSIPLVRRNIENLKILSIGPKNEGELLLLRAHGFKKNNITAIDLFSYSPCIQLMDMHRMDFKDNTFEIIISSKVLSYSKDEEVKKAIREMVRVAKNGAIMAIGLAWRVNKGEDEEYAGNRFDGWLNELFGYFGSNIDYVYWRHEEKKDDGMGDMTTIFKIKK